MFFKAEEFENASLMHYVVGNPKTQNPETGIWNWKHKFKQMANFCFKKGRFERFLPGLLFFYKQKLCKNFFTSLNIGNPGSLCVTRTHNITQVNYREHMRQSLDLKIC